MEVVLAILAVALALFVLIRTQDLVRRLEQSERRIDQLRADLERRPPLEPRPIVVDLAPVRTRAAATRPPVVRGPAPSPSRPPAPPTPGRSRPAFDFEELFGRRLAIWAGGGTLALAGFFIVKYAIDQGLLSPIVRVGLGATFGLVLIAAAEFAHRQAARVRDPRVAQALCGAGIATLYGAVLMAAELYGLLGPAPAFAAMVAVTAAALSAATRFGAPSALLGLAGGFAAPMLARAGPDNTALLVLYLCLTIAALSALARRQSWPWLGVLTLIGGFGWSLLLTLTGDLDTSATVAMALMLVILGVLAPLHAGGDGSLRRPLQIVGGLMAAAQAAALIALSGYAVLDWCVYGLVSAALVWLAWRDARLRLIPPLTLLIGLIALPGWPDPGPARLFAVLGGMAVIFGGPAAYRLWRDGGRLEAIQLALLLVDAWIITHLHLWDWLGQAGSTGVALILAAAAGALAFLGWRRPDRLSDSRFATLASTAILLLLAAAIFGPDPRWTPICVAVVAAAAVALRARSSDGRLTVLAALVVGLAGLNLLIPPPAETGYDLFEGVGVVGAVGQSFSGSPVLLNSLPSVAGSLSWLGLPGAVLLTALILLGDQTPPRLSRLARLLGGLMLASAIFVWIKHGFGLDTREAFVSHGLLERVVVDQLLFAAGYLLLLSGRRTAGAILIGVAALRVGLYSLVLYNPGLVTQSVGAWPLLNLLAPAYLAPLAWLALAERRVTPSIDWKSALGVGQAVLIVAWALLSVRQMFQGAILTTPGVSEAESIGYSLSGVILALAFLGWGIRRQARLWRILSLVLMLAAVGKVFLLDTAGLEGLTRIASFIALGLSLILIGWVYGRFLRSDRQTA